MLLGTRASLLVTRALLPIRNKKLLGAPGIATRSILTSNKKLFKFNSNSFLLLLVRHLLLLAWHLLLIAPSNYSFSSQLFFRSKLHLRLPAREEANPGHVIGERLGPQIQLAKPFLLTSLLKNNKHL